MAGGKQTPRQKMINLMYIVFIAMVALNISTEVLSAFGVMNERFESANEQNKTINSNAFASLEQKATEEPQKYLDAFEKARQVHEVVKELYDYIDSIKNEMIKVAPDDAYKNKMYQLMDQADLLDQRFFGADGFTPEGKAFVGKIDNFKKQMMEFAGANEDLRAKIKAIFDTSPIKNSEGNEIDWLKYNFEGYPMIASMSRFSQIQNDLLITEQDILSDMLEGQLKAEVSMTNYTTLLEQPRSAYYQDETFDGSIVLGRKDNKTMPSEVELYLDGNRLNQNQFEIVEGRVKLKVNSGTPGEHKISGNLHFDQEGERITVPVSQIFATIPRPNAAVISADKMNVVYRAVGNPMTISMPGVPDNKVSASAPGLRKVSGSRYILKPGRGSDVRISVTGEIDGQKFSSSQVFRIKDVPRPVGSIGGSISTGDNIKRSKSYLENARIGALFEDFDFDLSLSVTSFKMFVPGQPSVEVRGNRMDAKAKSVLARAKRGDVVQIFDISVTAPSAPDYRVKKAQAVSVEITN